MTKVDDVKRRETMQEAVANGPTEVSVERSILYCPSFLHTRLVWVLSWKRLVQTLSIVLALCIYFDILPIGIDVKVEVGADKTPSEFLKTVDPKHAAVGDLSFFV